MTRTDWPAGIVVELYEDPETGENVAECKMPRAVVRSRRGSTLCDLARVVAETYDLCPQTIVSAMRNGIPAFAPAPLSFWAARTVTEGSTSARFVAWKPFGKEASDA